MSARGPGPTAALRALQPGESILLPGYTSCAQLSAYAARLKRTSGAHIVLRTTDSGVVATRASIEPSTSDYLDLL